MSLTMKMEACCVDCEELESEECAIEVPAILDLLDGKLTKDKIDNMREALEKAQERVGKNYTEAEDGDLYCDDCYQNRFEPTDEQIEEQRGCDAYHQMKDDGEL